MARRTKEERLALEKKWQVENNMPNATCEGKFYIWNGGGTELCPVRRLCKFNSNYEQSVKDRTEFKLPRVNFYYVDGFRNCQHRKKLENEQNG